MTSLFFLQNFSPALASVADCLLALILFGGSILSSGKEHRWKDGLNLTLVATCAILLIKVGTISQAFLLQTFFLPTPGDFGQGALYFLEHDEFDFLSMLKTVCAPTTGVLAGTVIAILAIKTRLRDSLFLTMSMSVFILLVDDSLRTCSALIQYKMSAVGVVFQALLGQWQNSVACDVAGGWLIGLICYYVSVHTRELSSRRGARMAIHFILKWIAVTSGSLAVIFALIYPIFIHPVPENVSAVVSTPSQVLTTYELSTMWLERTSDTEFDGPFEIDLSSTTAGSGSLMFFRLENCSSDEDALRQVTKTIRIGQEVSITARKVEIPITDFASRLTIWPDGGSENELTVSLPGGVQSRGFTAVYVPGLAVNPGRGAKIGLYQDVTWKLVLGGLDASQLLGAKITLDGRSYALQTSRKVKATTCLAEPITVTTDQKAIQQNDVRDLSSRFVLVIPKGTFSTSISLSPLAEFRASNASGRFGSGSYAWPDGMATEFGALTRSGSVSVGLNSYPLSSSIFVAGRFLNISNDSTGRIYLTGISNYVLVDGQLVTNALFWHLPIEWQLFFFPALFSFVIWASPKLSSKILSWFKQR